MRKAWLIAAVTVASLFWGAAQEKRKPKPPDVEVVEIQIRRQEGRVSFDGKVRNAGEQAVRGLQLIFYFLSSDRKTVATKRGPVEEPELEPGGETEFHLDTPDTARAVEVRVEAKDRDERELKVTKPGPYAIE